MHPSWLLDLLAAVERKSSKGQGSTEKIETMQKRIKKRSIKKPPVLDVERERKEENGKRSCSCRWL
jgi:hypothetical protein